MDIPGEVWAGLFGPGDAQTTPKKARLFCLGERQPGFLLSWPRREGQRGGRGPKQRTLGPFRALNNFPATLRAKTVLLIDFSQKPLHLGGCTCLISTGLDRN